MTHQKRVISMTSRGLHPGFGIKLPRAICLLSTARQVALSFAVTSELANVSGGVNLHFAKSNVSVFATVANLQNGCFAHANCEHAMSAENPLLFRARRDIERVEIQRAKVAASLSAIDAELLRLRSFVEQYEIYVGEQERKNSSPRYRMSTREITDIAVSIIERSESPLTIQEIIERLDARSIEIGGENKSGNLAAYLSKDVRVRHERGFGWMLSAKALFPEELSGQASGESLKTSTSPLRGRRSEAGGSHERDTRARQPAGDVDDDDFF